MTVTSPASRVFTTFEVAKLCGVFHTTVINWVNKGKLKARTTPGGHRRIAAGDLIDFMRQFEMPVPANLTDTAKKVLVVEDDPIVQKLLLKTLGALRGVEVQACAGGLEAMMLIGKEAPDLLILDINIPQVNGFDVLKLLRSNEQTRPIRVIAVSGTVLTLSEQGFIREHADELQLKPLVIAEFRRKAVELLEPDDATQHELQPARSPA